MLVIPPAALLFDHELGLPVVAVSFATRPTIRYLEETGGLPSVNQTPPMVRYHGWSIIKPHQTLWFMTGASLAAHLRYPFINPSSPIRAAGAPLRSGMTCLMWSCQWGNTEIVQNPGVSGRSVEVSSLSQAASSYHD